MHSIIIHFNSISFKYVAMATTINWGHYTLEISCFSFLLPSCLQLFGWKTNLFPKLLFSNRHQ